MVDNLKNKAIKGMAWVGVEKGFNYVISFVFGLIMARLLVPSDYGIVGMLSIFTAIAGTLLDSGFANALIQKADRTDVDYCTVFYTNLIMSIGIYAVFYFSAPYIASFYNMPILTDVARISTIGFLLNGLMIVQTARLTINLNFRTQTLATLCAHIVGGTVGIYLAYFGYGVWALVWQGLCMGVVRLIVIWTSSGWWPSLVFSLASFNKLFSFGSKLLCSSMINTVYQNIYTIVIGRAFDAKSLGLYTRGKQFVDIPTGVIQEMVLKVNYPILASFQDDNETLIRVYKKFLRTPMFVLYPCLFGLSIIAKPMVEVLIGEKWLPCVPFLQILAISCLFRPLSHINLNLLYVKGRSDLVLKLEVIKKPVAFILLFLMLPLGIYWFCASAGIYSFIAFAFNCYYTNKLLKYGMFQQLMEVLPILGYCVVMSAVVWFAMMPFTLPAIKLAVGVVAGVVSYIAVSGLCRDPSLREVWKIICEKTVKKFQSQACHEEI